jgi:hypothetical protein
VYVINDPGYTCDEFFFFACKIGNDRSGIRVMSIIGTLA